MKTKPTQSPPKQTTWEKEFDLKASVFASFHKIEHEKEFFDTFIEGLKSTVRNLIAKERKEAYHKGYMQGREEGLNLFNKVQGTKILAVGLVSSEKKKAYAQGFTQGFKSGIKTVIKGVRLKSVSKRENVE